MFKQEFLYDKRLIDRLVKRGVISREDYEKHLASIGDASSKAEPLKIGDNPRAG